MMKPPVQPGDTVKCVQCDGRGYIASPGISPVPIVCPGCDGTREQDVAGTPT